MDVPWTEYLRAILVIGLPLILFMIIVLIGYAMGADMFGFDGHRNKDRNQ